MKHIIILYLPGHAGNFLTRLFSLGNETLPHLPVNLLEQYIYTGKPNEHLNRLELYSFKEVFKYYDWQQFHRAWADFRYYTKYELLNVFYNSKYSITHAIHPFEFKMLEHGIELLDQTEFYYVDLDLEKHSAWVDSQQQKLKFYLRDNEVDDFHLLKDQYHMQAISLTNILKSDNEFLKEYVRVCNLMSLAPNTDQALLLYQDWIKVRKN